MEVKTEDRKEEVEYLRMACNLAELGINYEQADLILKLQKRLSKLNGDFSIKDGVEVYHEWRRYWGEYFER